MPSGTGSRRACGRQKRSHPGRAAGEDGGVEAVSAQDVQQVLGLDSSAKVTLPKMDGFGDYTVTVQLHKQVKVELPLKLVEA